MLNTEIQAKWGPDFYI